MKKDKNYWGPVYDEFIRLYPELSEQMIDWYPSGQTEITIKIIGGKKYAYDGMNSTPILIYDPDEVFDKTEEDVRKLFSENLNCKLYKVGKTQDTLSYETGISPTTISKYVHGKATPSLYNARKIAQSLNCNINELLY